MSNTIKEKDWWTLFKYMSESKLKQRHNEAVDIEPTLNRKVSAIYKLWYRFCSIGF